MPGSDPVEFEVTVIHRTEKAWLVQDPCGEDGDGIWIPESQLTVVEDRGDEVMYTIEIPEWLAEEKEFI